MCNNGFGGGNCCWIIILLIIIWCCCGNSGWNGGGNCCCCECCNGGSPGRLDFFLTSFTGISPFYANHPLTRSEKNTITGPRQKPVITVVIPTVEPRRKPADKTEISQSIRTRR